jgi:MinD-like ATPase involved in chromosome partitioning or flagellar assembly/CheY-like chemotaxis protein
LTEKAVLVIDADGASRDFLVRALTEKGRKVLETSLGKEGLIFAWRDRPALIIIDPRLPDLSGEDLIRRLRHDTRTASIPAIALSSDSDPARSKTCIEAGFNEYMFKTSEVVPTLMESIARFLGEAASAAVETFEERGERGKLIVFLSAKGGTGTSSLCANIGTNLGHHQPQARVVVVDCVLPIGSIAQIVGYDGSANLVTIANKEKIEDAASFVNFLPEPPPWRFKLLAGSPDPESANSLHVERIEEVVTTLLAGSDYVLVDLGRSLARFSLPLIQKADLIALILAPDLSAVTLTKIMLGYLRAQRVKPEVMFPILNRAVGLEGMTRLEIEQFLGIGIKGALPHLSGNFALANNQHLPISVKFPHETATIALQEMAEQMATTVSRPVGSR